MQLCSWLEWQIDYLLYLQNFRDISHHVFDKFFIYITLFGEITIPILVICLFYWVINKKVGIYILWSYLFGFVTNTFAKTTACIYRPWILDCRVHPVPEAIPAATGYSFPSGHTAGVMSIWGGLAYSYWNNKIFRYLCFFIIISVMVSRNYLGVHTPQDVVVSFFISLFVLYIAKKALDYSETGKNHDLIVTAIVCIVTILVTLYADFKHYPIHYLFGKILYSPDSIKIDCTLKTGFLFGSFAGWLIERRFIDYNPQTGTILKKIIRYLLGTAILFLFLHTVLNICSSLYIKYAIFLISGLFVTCLYPLFIKKCRL